MTFPLLKNNLKITCYHAYQGKELSIAKSMGYSTVLILFALWAMFLMTLFEKIVALGFLISHFLSTKHSSLGSCVGSPSSAYLLNVGVL